MPNLPNWSPSFLSAIAVLITVVYAAFPLVLIAYGVVLSLAGRRGQIEPATRRRGWIILGLCLAAGVVYLAAALLSLSGTSAAVIALVVVSGLVLLGATVQMGLFLRQPIRALRVVTGALLADTLLLFACLCVTVPLANRAKQIMAYNNFNEPEVRAALAKNPNDAAAHSSLAQIDMMRGNSASEVTEWRQVLRVEPDNENALFMLANRLVNMHQPGEARPLFQKLAAGDSDYAASARRWLARHRPSGTPLTP